MGQHGTAFDFALAALAIWCGGVLLSLAVLGLRQWRFVRTLGTLTPRPDWGDRVFRAETDSGPALVGVLRPMIVAPADFDRRYNTEERRIVIAHERAHMAQGDPLINACAALLRCVGWFNPLLHVAANALRTDQELACDAAVLARGAAARTYAEALIKASTGAAPVPLGCAWPAPTPRAFKKRILMLKRAAPSPAQALLGAAVIAIAAVGVCAMSWAAQPARVVTVVEDVHRGESLRAASELMGEQRPAPGLSEDGMEPPSGPEALEAAIEAQGAARESLLEHLDAQREAREAALESRRAERESDLAERQSALAQEREAFFRSRDAARRQPLAEGRVFADTVAEWDRDLAEQEREIAREGRQIAREHAALDADLAAQEREIAGEDRQIAQERTALDVELTRR